MSLLRERVKSRKSTASGQADAEPQAQKRPPPLREPPKKGRQLSGRGVSARKLYKRAILDALERGPATASEIAARLGFYPHTVRKGYKATGVTSLCYVLEHEKLIGRAGRRAGKTHKLDADKAPVVRALVVEKST